MKIMITGGLGFIGSHLVDTLTKSNHEIIILTKSLSKKNNLKLDLKKNKITIKKLNIENFKKFSEIIIKYNPDVLFHLAGETSHSNSFLDPMNDVDLNIKSTICALETIRKNKIKCQIHSWEYFCYNWKTTKITY